MVEELKEIYFIGKKFDFVQRKREKFIYSYEEKDLEKLNILELEFNNSERRVKKIDIYTLHKDELLESIHVFRGDDNKVDIYYYPCGTELISINSKKIPCDICMYKNYSQKDEDYYQESYEIEITKKGHKKHKILSELPLQEDYFISKENKLYYVTSHKLSEFKKMTKLLMPSLNQIEKTLFKCEAMTFDIDNKESIQNLSIEESEILKKPNYKINQWLGTGQLERVLENEKEEILPLTMDDNYPKNLYIYDREYKAIGKKSNAVVYGSRCYNETIDIEVYFDESKVTEFRYIEYKGKDNKHSKKRIIRAVLKEDGSIKTSLVNRSRQNVILSSHELENAMVRADTIINAQGKIIEDSIIINSKIGRFELFKHPSNSYLFVDGNNEEHRFTSSNYITYKIFIMYTPAIMNMLQNRLISNEEQKNSYKKLKKVL